jgi:hypothetical protein
MAMAAIDVVTIRPRDRASSSLPTAMANSSEYNLPLPGILLPNAVGEIAAFDFKNRYADR